MSSEDDDGNSLFGSPSPSRSPSPALALPTAGSESGALAGSSAVNIAQNVGAIALPGSQHFSELPKDPLALSSSFPPVPPSLACTPPTGQVDKSPPAPPLSASPSDPSTPLSWSRASSVVPPAPAPKKGKRSKRKEAEPSPALSIALPDPSTPPPPNFLRSQVALLGTAGLVAGLKPGKMQLGTSRGSTPTNPIVLDDGGRRRRKTVRGTRSRASRVSAVVYDEKDAPKLGKRSGSVSPSPVIDPALLPAPTNKEIVAMLIEQKDIFPVLQSILRLIPGLKAEEQVRACTSGTQRTATKRAFDVQPLNAPATLPIIGLRAPPLKRRKLSRVPAGAADWDVPYPFQEGEGPEEYRKTWERERAKQLISQLVNFIRTAARKVATKKYFLQQAARCQVQAKSGQTVQTQRAQSAPASVKEIVTDQLVDGLKIFDDQTPALDKVSIPPAEPSRPASLPQMQTTPEIPAIPSCFDAIPPQLMITPQSTQETSFDHLISSLLAASSTADMAGVQNGGIHCPETNILPEPSAAFVSAESGEDVNDGLINSWMNIFQTFPIPLDGFASALDAFSLPYQDTQPLSSSASGPLLSGFNFDFFDVTPALNFNYDTHSQSAQTIIDSSSPSFLPTQNTSQHEAEQFMRDIGLDPILALQSDSQPDVTCDPTLFSISHPQPRTLVDLNQISSLTQTNPTSFVVTPGAEEETSGTPRSTASPMLSSSRGSSNADPSTPPSATWDSGAPDIAFPPPLRSELEDPSSSQARVDEREGHEDDNDVEEGRRFRTQEKGKWKEKTRVDKGDANENEGGNNQVELTTVPMDTSTDSAPLPPDTSQSDQNKPGKQEIIRLAQERRQQLVDELERVKTQLWATTIEQSVLVELQKQLLP